ncbi:MAG: hypothetical protein HY819_21295 [Acidobacteria bacterium]|nr:hypothetical protein [Acidobacteriota bacterium]
MKKFSSILLVILLVASMFSVNTLAAEKRESKTRTVAKIGVGTALGAGVGALIGGGRGATAGALIGGGAMTAHSLARRNSGQGRKTRTISTIAAGSLVGTGVGAAIGGKKGAGIGALVGGGSSTIYALTRKDLKEPRTSSNRYRVDQDASYNNTSNNQNNQIDQSRPGFSSNLVQTNTANRVNINEDPYQRLSGPQGALVGNFLANGSRAVAKPTSAY